MRNGPRSERPRQTFAMHRQILGLEAGDGCEVDHRNGDGLDNRRSNLRLVTRAQNKQNVSARGGYSKHRGVTFDRRRQKWKAQVKLNGTTHNVGRFDDELEAARAASAFRRQHMPFSEADQQERGLTP